MYGTLLLLMHIPNAISCPVFLSVPSVSTVSDSLSLRLLVEEKEWMKESWSERESSLLIVQR